MDAATIIQPIVVKDDSTVAAEPRADAPSHEPQSAGPIAASAAKAAPVQIVLILLGAIAFLYFARPVVLPVVLALYRGNDFETAHPLVVLLPHSVGALRRRRALPSGVRHRDWFLSTGPAGVDVDE